MGGKRTKASNLPQIKYSVFLTPFSEKPSAYNFSSLFKALLWEKKKHFHSSTLQQFYGTVPKTSH